MIYLQTIEKLRLAEEKARVKYEKTHENNRGTYYEEKAKAEWSRAFKKLEQTCIEYNK